MNELTKVKAEYEKVQIRIKRTRDLFLDSQFTKEEYDETILHLTIEKQNLETKLARLSKADEEFNKSLTTIFELASKAYGLFKSSDGEEKRQIIKILFPNLYLEGERLDFTLQKPFDLFVNLGDCPNWLHLPRKFRTERFDDMRELSLVFTSFQVKDVLLITA